MYAFSIIIMEHIFLYTSNVISFSASKCLRIIFILQSISYRACVWGWMNMKNRPVGGVGQGGDPETQVLVLVINVTL